jgi:phage FluMu gp28-like protein
MADKNMTMREMIKAEYARCAIDPAYFMRKYCKIQHPVKGRMLFDLFPFQEDMLSDMNEHQFNIILKSRQLGISTLSAGFSLYRMLFKKDYNVLVIATQHSVATNLVTKVLMMYEGLPSWLKPAKETVTKTTLRLKNGSQVKAVASSPGAGRSEALSLLIIDEAAFIRHADDIWASAQQTLSTGGSAIVLSTPNGVGNFINNG